MAKEVDTRYTQDRELSWLRFNERVLEEARDESVPLFERLKFAAIFTSNLDEFFMIRVGSICDMTLSKQTHVDNKSGLTPDQQLAAICIAWRNCGAEKGLPSTSTPCSCNFAPICSALPLLTRNSTPAWLFSTAWSASSWPNSSGSGAFTTSSSHPFCPMIRRASPALVHFFSSERSKRLRSLMTIIR